MDEIWVNSQIQIKEKVVFCCKLSTAFSGLMNTLPHIPKNFHMAFIGLLPVCFMKTYILSNG